MAKIIRHNGEFSHYEPGIIYDIGVIDPQTDTRIPFYVGETCDPDGRLLAHKRAGKNADDSSTLVYQYIKLLDENNLKWTMETLAKFEQEGPTDLEDEWIMRHLYDGCKLKNMKKGNANWMAEREACATDMRVRGINSFRKYKEVLSVEQQQAEADRKHAEWMREQTERDKAQAKAAAAREIIEAQMAEQRAEQIEKNRLQDERTAKIKAEAAARWEADRPAREARMKAVAEANQAKEDAKQAAIAARIEAQKRKDKEPIEVNIKTLQTMIHLYNQFGCSDAVLQTANERLTELQELAK